MAEKHGVFAAKTNQKKERRHLALPKTTRMSQEVSKRLVSGL